MIKILIGFIIFSALALFILFKSGGDIDMGGEKHGAEASHTEEAKQAAPAASTAAPAASTAAPAASAPKQ
jgi:hypothetical protein